jgi:hypothetical protein
MSLSAFGVDHGEVSKAFRMPGSFSGAASKTKKPFQAAGLKMGHGMARAGHAVNRNAANRFINGSRETPSAGQRAQGKVGMGMLRAGAAMASKPGTTGAVAAGGVGGGGYAAYRSKKKPGQV